jgi:translation initiation factor 2 gamma subunit (eIF-2gamma)
MIVGTAGHIDHGKTALVRALTGVDTDRLKEEKARGITIDLDFAYLRSQTACRSASSMSLAMRNSCTLWSPAPEASISLCLSSLPTTASCRRHAST